MNWALRNGNIDLIDDIAQQILENLDGDQFENMRIFDSLSDRFLVTPDLLVISKFYNYKKKINEGDLFAGISIIHELLLSNSPPDRFFLTVLQEASRLLNVFNSDQVCIRNTPSTGSEASEDLVFINNKT